MIFALVTVKVSNLIESAEILLSNVIANIYTGLTGGKFISTTILPPHHLNFPLFYQTKQMKTSNF